MVGGRIGALSALRAAELARSLPGSLRQEEHLGYHLQDRMKRLVSYFFAQMHVKTSLWWGRGLMGRFAARFQKRLCCSAHGSSAREGTASARTAVGMNAVFLGAYLHHIVKNTRTASHCTPWPRAGPLARVRAREASPWGAPCLVFSGPIVKKIVPRSHSDAGA